MLTSFGISGICIRDTLLKLSQDNIFIEWEIILDNVLLYMIKPEIWWGEKSLGWTLDLGKSNNSDEWVRFTNLIDIKALHLKKKIFWLA